MFYCTVLIGLELFRFSTTLTITHIPTPTAMRSSTPTTAAMAIPATAPPLNDCLSSTQSKILIIIRGLV